jgi:hypothetical protein
MVNRRLHNGHEVSLRFCAFKKRDLNQPALKRQCLNVPGEVITADLVQNHIDSSPAR